MRQRNIAVLLVASTIFWGSAAAAQQQPDLSSDTANTLTHVGISVVKGSTAYLVIGGNERQKQAGRQAVDALLVTVAATALVKEITNQPRPNNPQADQGFPSGHASITFAFARSLAEEYEDWGKLAYLWATGVSWSRVRREDHSIPQVLAGAALGWYIADRSVHSHGGLLNGLIVKDSSLALISQATAGLSEPRLSLWQTSW